MQFWNELEGQTIDGLFPLRRLVRSEGRSAWFETETPAPQAGPATISLTEALTDADEVTARLQAAQKLKHPNLVTIHQVGQVRLDNTLVVYAVMEPIEQSLSDVLQIQALSAEEGREVAEALVGALTAVHGKGMSHGHVEAASVLAAQETVKLRSDCLQMTAGSQAEDVAGIGGTLFQAFTQRKAANATDALVNRIPAPFGEIVRNALSRRWSLAQIANALKPAPPVAAAAPPLVRNTEPPVVKAVAKAEVVASAAVATPHPAPASTPRPAAATPPRPAAPARAPGPPANAQPLPVAPPVALPVAEPAPPIVDAYEPTPRGARQKPWALYGAIAVILLAVLGWYLLRPHEEAGPAASPGAPAVSQSPVAATAPAPAVNKPAGKPSAGTAQARPHRPAAAVADAAAATESVGAAAGAVAGPRSTRRTIWRVVVYTYRGQTKAADSVARIQGAHPDLEAAVFNPTGSDVYMVTLGGSMDRPGALAMLAKARREGLPQDTYVRNFSQ